LAVPLAQADLIPLSSLNLVGNGPGLSELVTNASNQTVLRLTPNFDTNIGSTLSPAGAAWTKTAVNVADPFSVDFKFQMTDPTGNLDFGPSGKGPAHGGDGIAFLIQNSPAGDQALGLGAGGMGFMFIPNSLAIMLDTYQNAAPDFYGDPSNNYIGVNTRGTLFNVPHHFCTGGILTADASIGSDLPASEDTCTKNPELGMTGFGGVPALSVNMDDGNVHDLVFDYVPGTLTIFLDSTKVLTVPVNFQDLLDLQNGKDAFLGFTAGTRNAYQNQDILSFAIAPEPSWGQLCVPLAMFLAIGLTRWLRRAKA
jgi:hypothetical protein